MNTLQQTPIPLRIRKARIATFLGFMMIGAMMYIWSTGVSVFDACPQGWRGRLRLIRKETESDC